MAIGTEFDGAGESSGAARAVRSMAVNALVFIAFPLFATVAVAIWVPR